MIEAARELHASGQLRIRVGISCKLNMIQIGSDAITSNLNRNVRKCVVGALVTLKLHTAGASGSIAAGDNSTAGQQLPAAIEPELQRIWRSA